MPDKWERHHKQTIFTVRGPVAVHLPGRGRVVGRPHVPVVRVQWVGKEHVADILGRQHPGACRFKPTAHPRGVGAMTQPGRRVVLLRCHRHADGVVWVAEIRGGGVKVVSKDSFIQEVLADSQLVITTCSVREHGAITFVRVYMIIVVDGYKDHLYCPLTS